MITRRVLHHTCPWPHCTAQVPSGMWGCRAHWFALPKGIRLGIGRAYRFGIDHECHPTRSYVAAHRAALAWIAAHDAHVGAVTPEGEA